MNKTIVNIELDINRHPDYINTIKQFKKTIKNFISDIRNIYSSGQISERNYSIRHDIECNKKDIEYINSLADIDYKQYEIMYNKLIQLQSENIAMKKALKENNIIVEFKDI
jgi:hypothetical protein